MGSPTDKHWKVAMRVLRYLKGTKTMQLKFGNSDPPILKAYCDSNWGNCLNTRKSVSGFSIFLGNSLVSSKTKKQATVSRSSGKAEYWTIAATTAELLWILHLLRDFNIKIQEPILLSCDNKSAIQMLLNPTHHEKNKHVNIDCHFAIQFEEKGIHSVTLH